MRKAQQQRPIACTQLATESAKMEILQETINIGLEQWTERRWLLDDTCAVHESSPQIPGRDDWRLVRHMGK
jgi:hypothetical protein